MREIYDACMRTNAISSKPTRRWRRYRLEPASLGKPLPGIDLDKALQLADSLDPEIGARTSGPQLSDVLVRRP